MGGSQHHRRLATTCMQNSAVQGEASNTYKHCPLLRLPCLTLRLPVHPLCTSNGEQHVYPRPDPHADPKPYLPGRPNTTTTVGLRSTLLCSDPPASICGEGVGRAVSCGTALSGWLTPASVSLPESKVTVTGASFAASCVVTACTGAGLLVSREVSRLTTREASRLSVGASSAARLPCMSEDKACISDYQDLRSANQGSVLDPYGCGQADLRCEKALADLLVRHQLALLCSHLTLLPVRRTTSFPYHCQLPLLGRQIMLCKKV